MSPSQPITWTVERFQNGGAILKNAQSGEKLTVPRSQLADSVKEGDVVTAEFYLAKDDKKRRENLAKALLEEILGSQ